MTPMDAYRSHNFVRATETIEGKPTLHYRFCCVCGILDNGSPEQNPKLTYVWCSEKV